MNNSVYSINKGINKSIEFRGLKAQYIGYLAGGLVALLILFAILYIVGVNSTICIILILGSGGFMIFKIYRLSDKYGEHGMMKALARKSIPKVLKSRSRALFLHSIKPVISKGV